MKIPALSLSLFSLLVMLACSSSNHANDNAAQNSDIWQRYIVGFSTQKLHDEAMSRQAQTLDTWRNAIDAADIRYVRSLMQKAWVIQVKGAAKVRVLESLQALEQVQYVEMDQIIRIGPIEQKHLPLRLH